MTLEKEPFRSYTLDEEKKLDTFTIRLNKDERFIFNQCKNILQQEKDSTAMKQLALEIGSEVIQRPELKKYIGVVLNNYRKNKRLNIVSFD